MKRLPSILTGILLSASNLDASTFHAPEGDGVVLVQVDRLPLDKNTIEWVAYYFSELAAAQVNKSPEEIQSAAKLIALSQQLNPANENIRSTINLLTEGRSLPKKDAKNEKIQQERLLKILDYLSKNYANNEPVRNFTVLTNDALSSVSSYEQYQKPAQEELTLWKGSIAPLSDFMPKPEIEIANNDPITDSIPPTDETTENLETQTDTEEEILLAQWNNTELTISTLASTYKKDSSYKTEHDFGLKTFKVTIDPFPEGKPFEIKSFPVLDNSDHLTHQGQYIEKSLQSLWPSFQPAIVKVTLGDAYSYRNDRAQSAAAITVALDSSLHNKDLRDNLLVLTTIDSSGTFNRSNSFWNQLDKLVEVSSQNRILVAPSTEGDLRQLLAYDEGEFFLKNEIIAVKDLSEARMFSSSKDDLLIARGTLLFKEVQTALKNKSVRSMTANKFVRERLKTVLEIIPGHISAKMLLLYGERKKLAMLERKYLAYELTDIIRPANYFLSRRNYSDINANHSIGIAETINSRIEELEEYVDSKDEDLLKPVTKLASEIRILGKARSKVDKGEGRTSPHYLKAVTTGLAKVKTDYNSIMLGLSKETGIKYTPPSK